MADLTTISLRQKIRQIMLRIRSATPLKADLQWQKPVSCISREDYLGNAKVKATSITLLPTGCEYAKVGGCTMCGEWSGSNKGMLIPAEFHVAQFTAACSSLLSREDIQWIRIYQEGSFINEAEVERNAVEFILRLASNLRCIKRITIESRPEHVTLKNSKLIRSYVRLPVELEIGIGLEAQDNFIRNICIGKGTKLSTYKRAVDNAHSNNIIALAYVLLKPPFLSEKEALEEAVKSVEFAFEIGFDEVYIQAASIHEWSLSELMWFKELYTLPWLWSMFDVVKRTAHLGKVRIGGLEYFPPPSTTSQNYKDACGRFVCDCSKKGWQLIQEFNASLDIHLLSGITCECQTVWKTVLEETQSQSLYQRVTDIIEQVSVEDYLQIKDNQSNPKFYVVSR